MESSSEMTRNILIPGKIIYRQVLFARLLILMAEAYIPAAENVSPPAAEAAARTGKRAAANVI